MRGSPSVLYQREAGGVTELDSPSEPTDRTSPTVLSWPDAQAGPWSVMVHWQELDGRAECVGLEIWNGTQIGGAPMAGRSASPITTSALRELRPDSMIRKARLDHARALDGAIDSLHAYQAAQNADRLKALGQDSWTKPSPFTKGRRKADVSETGSRETAPLRKQSAALKKSAQWPKSANRRGRPPGPDKPPEHWQRVAEVYRLANDAGFPPTAAVAAEFDKAYSTVNKWVARCREMGLLPPTRRGKAKS
jgi:hypothetical protein